MEELKETPAENEGINLNGSTNESEAKRSKFRDRFFAALGKSKSTSAANKTKFFSPARKSPIGGIMKIANFNFKKKNTNGNNLKNKGLLKGFGITGVILLAVGSV